MKKDQYFNLEVNLLNDDNIAGMMLELGAANALGVYVMLLLHLRTKDNYEASCRPLPLKALAKRYDVDVDLIGRILREFDLFEVDEERQMFRAPYLDRVMKTLEEKWRINAENGKKGGRPRKTKKRADADQHQPLRRIGPTASGTQTRTGAGRIRKRGGRMEGHALPHGHGPQRMAFQSGLHEQPVVLLPLGRPFGPDSRNGEAPLVHRLSQGAGFVGRSGQPHSLGHLLPDLQMEAGFVVDYFQSVSITRFYFFQ